MSQRWRVVREVNGYPYRVEIPSNELLNLQIEYLRFCEVRRSSDETLLWVLGNTDCPPDRAKAAVMTLEEKLFLSRDGRLVDNNFGHAKADGGRCVWTTELGRSWLAEKEAIA